MQSSWNRKQCLSTSKISKDLILIIRAFFSCFTTFQPRGQREKIEHVRVDHIRQAFLLANLFFNYDSALLIQHSKFLQTKITTSEFVNVIVCKSSLTLSCNRFSRIQKPIISLAIGTIELLFLPHKTLLVVIFMSLGIFRLIEFNMR